MRRIALSEIKDDLSRFLHEAEFEQIVITRHGKPAGVLVGFANEDDWFDYRVEHDPRFLERIAAARASIQAGKGVHIEDLASRLKATQGPKEPLQRTGRSRSRRRKIRKSGAASARR